MDVDKLTVFEMDCQNLCKIVLTMTLWKACLSLGSQLTEKPAKKQYS